MKIDPPVREDYSSWRANPVTKFYLQILFDNREGKKEEVAEGKVSGGDALQQEIGRMQGIKDAIDFALFNFPVVDETPDNDNSETEE